MTSPDLRLTGERTLPGIATENYWFRRHEAAYLLAAAFCRGACAVDVGSGEGYGTALLRREARFAVGLDCAAEAVAHAAHRYAPLPFVRANAVDLPLGSATVEVVVALQVLEHVWDVPRFLGECRRVLRPGGTLVLSTPNRLTFPPGNAFHHREFSPGELRAALAPDFWVTRLAGLRHGRRLRRLDRGHPAGFVRAQLDGPVATWHPRLRQEVASIGARDFTVSYRDLTTCLDLIAVATPR